MLDVCCDPRYVGIGTKKMKIVAKIEMDWKKVRPRLQNVID